MAELNEYKCECGGKVMFDYRVFDQELNEFFAIGHCLACTARIKVAFADLPEANRNDYYDS